MLIGETLHGDYNQIVNDEMLDSCTNYECYKGLYSSFNSVNMFEIAHSSAPPVWRRSVVHLPRQTSAVVCRQPRCRAWQVSSPTSRSRSRLRHAFGMPGIPCVYYGSEWGIAGEKGGPDGDWALRPALNEPAPNELTAFITQLAHLRSALGRRTARAQLRCLSQRGDPE